MPLVRVPNRLLVRACLVIAAMPVAVRAQGVERGFTRAANEYLTSLVNAHDFSGSVLVARNHHIVLQRSYGFANREQRIPIDTATRFAIGSVTKAFVAAVVERLIHQGALSLRDPVARYLPEVGHGDSITIEHLLAHSAGIPDYYQSPEYRSSHCKPIAEAEFLEWVRRKPLEFRPGSGSAYSNSGYFVLAVLLERVTGLTLDSLLRREILAPLAMNATGSLTAHHPTPRLAAGYDAGFPPEHFQPAPCVDASWLFGSASLYSTTSDLLRWAELIARESLSVDSIARPRFGWGPRVRFGRNMVEQNGRIPLGFVSYVGIWPADSLVVIALGNAQVDAVERLGVALAAMALGQPYEAPRAANAPVALDSVQLGSYAGTYAIAPGFLLDVAARARGLELAGPDGIHIPLDTEGRDHFFFRTLYTPITFLRDSSGAVTALQWGTAFVAPRLARWPNETAR